MNKISNLFNSFRNIKKENIISIVIDILFFCSTFSILLFNGNSFVYLVWVFFVPFTLILFLELFFKRGIVIDAIVLISFGLVIMMLVSYVWNGFGVFNLTNILMVVMFNVFYQYFIYKKNFQSPLKLIFWSFILFVLVLFIMNYKDIFAGNFSRLGGEVANVNTVGITLALAFTISLYYIFFEKKYFAIIPSVLFFSFSLFTGSKVALLILGISAIITIFLFFGKRKIHYSLILIVVVVAVFLFVINLPAFSIIRIRIINFINGFFGGGKGDASTIVRGTMINEALSLFIRKPLIGWGFNGYSIYGSFGIYSHSTFSEVLANFGIVSFLLLESLMVIPVISAIKRSKSQGKNTAFPIIMGIVLLLSQIATMILGAKSLYLLIAALNGSVFAYQDRKTVLISKNIFAGLIKR